MVFMMTFKLTRTTGMMTMLMTYDVDDADDFVDYVDYYDDDDDL